MAAAWKWSKDTLDPGTKELGLIGLCSKGNKGERYDLECFLMFSWPIHFYIDSYVNLSKWNISLMASIIAVWRVAVIKI